MSTYSILITGGTGFLGSALVGRLASSGHLLYVLSRDADKVTRKFGDAVKPVTGVEQLPDAGEFMAVVNLAGAGIFDQRWSEARKLELRNSRIKLTEQLVNWLVNSNQTAKVLISGSAIGIYGDQGDAWVDETSEPRADFAQQLCADWEAAALKAQAVTRVCLVRTGLVLGAGGGLLQRMLLPFRLGLGGTLGDGRQWMSWIHIEDWLSIVEAMINNDEMRGAYNAVAPNPATNCEFSAALAKVLQRPMLLPLPGGLLRTLLGEMAALVLGSQRVLTQRLLAQNFRFQYPELEPALRQILDKHG